MRLKLVVIGGSHSGKEIPVSGPKFFIGRDRDCQLRPNSDVVSRHHCALIVEDGYVAVRDFNSKNGTLVDGVRVIGEQELHSGSELAIGPLRFNFSRALQAEDYDEVEDFRFTVDTRF